MSKSESKADENFTADVGVALDALRMDVTKLIKSMEQLAQSQAQAAGHRVTEAVSDATGALAAASADAKDRVRSASCELEASIERNPLTALLIAFGVGLSVSMLTRPRG